MSGTPTSNRSAASVLTVPEVPTWRMYRAMVGIGLICGLLIVSAYQFTAPIIAKNRAEALQKAIFEVLPAATSSRSFLRVEDRFEPIPDDAPSTPTAGEERVYAGYVEGGRLAGVAIEAQGMGYADVIKVLYGYDFEKQALVGFKVLESKETPGLGDKIAKDPSFLANFTQLDVSLAEGGTGLAHPVVVAPHGTKTSPWQIDAITGATISSNAVGDLLSQSTARWIPLLAPRRADFGE